jgi:N6-L-threonylcarbamoyladenine synthase
MNRLPKDSITILGIETSCDETAASILRVKNGHLEILSDVISSQVKLHAEWGGVVPNLAAREHLKNIVPVVEKSLFDSKITPKEIDLIAVTEGPGLIPALLIGSNAAKTLSYLWKKPLMGIHHIEGHIYANRINLSSKIEFPILCLVVSGGHTQLVLMKNHLDYRIIGETLDDAVGEAFDKVARILNLGYPGGPIISSLADSYELKADKYELKLPRPMMKSNNYNFSFSGLKTAVLYLTRRNEKLLQDKTFIRELCHEFQNSVIEVLVSKTIRAAKEFRPKTIMLAGGVSANQALREEMGNTVTEELNNTSFISPEIKYTGDNAAMIAAAAYYRLMEMDEKEKESLDNNWKTLEPKADFRLK